MLSDNKNERLLAYDILKVISIAAVLALHTQRDLETGVCFNPYLYYFARFAMPIFFMINGALILSKKTFSVVYYKKKCLKIVRLLVLWSALVSAYYFFVKNESIVVSIKNGIICILGEGLIPFWFFITFILIYTILLFGFSFIKKNIKTVLIILMIIGVTIDIASLFNIFINSGFFIQDVVKQMFRLWTWLFYFCLGWFLKENTILQNKRTLITLCVVFTVLSWLLQYEICFVYLKKINSGYLYGNIVIIMWCSFIFLLFQSSEYQLQKSRFFQLLGKLSNCSFGVLLLHMFFIDYFSLTTVASNTIEGTFTWIGLLLVCFIFSSICSKIPFIKKAFIY